MAANRFGKATRSVRGILRNAAAPATTATLAGLVGLVGLMGLIALAAGCGVAVQNVQPAEDLAAQRERPPGSVYLGWRVFTEKCARCHGAAGAGTGLAPNLVARMSDMGPRRFAHLVLVRYDLDDTAPRARDDAATREAQIEDILQRRDRPLAMPAWQGEPRVSTHILDLYAYLAARADGRQGTGRPPM